jgi:hypothetical protein
MASAMRSRRCRAPRRRCPTAGRESDRPALGVEQADAFAADKNATGKRRLQDDAASRAWMRFGPSFQPFRWHMDFSIV